MGARERGSASNRAEEPRSGSAGARATELRSPGVGAQERDAATMGNRAGIPKENINIP